MEQHNQNKIRVLVLEGFELTRLGLHSVLRNDPLIECIGEYNRIEAAVESTNEPSPDVILLDLYLSNGQAFRQIPKLLQTFTQSKLLALSSNQDESLLIESLHLGASGIFGKHQAAELLLKAIFAVFRGEHWVERNLSQRILQIHSGKLSEVITGNYPVNALATLTKREHSVACLVAKGLSAKLIADRLLISEKTVRNQLTAVYEKLEIKGRVELCLKAVELGFCGQVGPRCNQDKCPK